MTTRRSWSRTISGSRTVLMMLSEYSLTIRTCLAFFCSVMSCMMADTPQMFPASSLIGESVKEISMTTPSFRTRFVS